jgi:acyl-CoA thioesterase-1
MYRQLLFLLLSGLLSPALAAQPPTLLVVGDSLSAAFGFSADKGWVQRLQQRLADSGHPHQVVNASISGDTTRGGLSRLPSTLELHRPDIVVIELGANDGLRGTSLEEMYANLEKMVTLSQRHGARVLLLGMHLPPNYGPRYATQFHAVYRRLAEQLDIALVPFLLAGVADERQLMQPDNIHPTAEAQGRLLENIWPYLSSILPNYGTENSINSNNNEP